jgi:3D (Asp-Asp-Asp) domain-containing protein
MARRFALLALILVAEGCAGRARPVDQPPVPAPAPPPVRTSSFTATAYCTGTRTATGTVPTESTVAADPSVLRLGSRISITGLDERYNGVYVVTDTGPKVRGRHVDLYIPSCRDAVRFGRRRAEVAVMSK